MKKGIIFDMDGTLWDSAENVAKTWNIVLEKEHVDRVLTKEDMYAVMGKTMDVLAALLLPELETEQRMKIAEECYKIENGYLREHGGDIYDGIPEIFTKLKEMGCHISIVSNCQEGYIEAFLDHYHLWDYIDDKLCYGDTGLPKWDNIRTVVERNALDEAVYVGDIQGDYDASVKAGVGFIHAAYGFGTIDTEVPKIHTLLELCEVIS